MIGPENTMPRPRNPFPANATLREAWKEGYTAHEDTATVEDCPYSPVEEALQAAGWLAGWVAAREEMKGLIPTHPASM